MEYRLVNCRYSCIRFLFRRLNQPEPSSAQTARNALSMIGLLLANNFIVKVRITPLAFCLPFSWRLLVRYWTHVCFTTEKFERFAAGFDERAYFYHLTPRQLYKQCENWTHCVCEVFAAGQWYYHDSLLNSEHIPAVPILSHEALLKRFGIVICALRRPIV